MDEAGWEKLRKLDRENQQARKDFKFSTAGYFLKFVGGPLDGAPYQVCGLADEYQLPYNTKAIEKAGNRLAPGENGWTHEVASFDSAEGVAKYVRDAKSDRYLFVEAMTVEEYRKRGGVY